MPVLNFKGRTAIRSHHFTVPFYPLEIDAKKSFATNPASKPSLEDNLIIHGDNLHALKALVPHYGGKIKCIYIDPPYNTGNENWKYNDNVNNPMMQRWLKENGIGKDDMERHDKWLCMMWPRLELLKVLLAEDGVIFISIDDNEQHRLRMLLDEIFGEDNFIASIVWWSKYTLSNDASKISYQHENILFYAKNINHFQIGLLPRTKDMDDAYKNPDNDPKGDWKATPLHAKSGQIKDKYSVKFPNGIVWNCPEGRYPRYNKAKLIEFYNSGEIYFGKDGQSIPNKKTYLSEVKPGKTVGSFWSYKDVGSTHESNERFSEIVGKGKFNNPKGIQLIKQIIKVANVPFDGIILDSFAGSGTTAHAVLDLNKEDGGRRKFILVECEDYANDITAERVRRVIKGVPTAKDDKLKKGLGGSFTYCNLGPEFNEEGFLKCKSLPTYEVLARYVFYTATGEALQEFKKRGDYYVGRTKWGIAVFVVYEPDKEFLRSEDSSLHAQREASVLQTMQMEKCRQAYVFAMACFVPPEDLPQKRIVFCQMPFQIHKML